MTSGLRFWLAGALAAAMAALGGCGSLLPEREQKPAALYQLSAPDVSPLAEEALGGQLVIDVPETSRGLDTDRIAVRPSPLELKYLADSRWSDRAPDMLQSLLVESFQAAMPNSGVGRIGEGLRADLVLVTGLREFEIDDSDGGRPTIRVRIIAQLLKQPGGRLIATKSFESGVKARGRSADSAIAAFNDAFGEVGAALVSWTVDTAKAYVRAGANTSAVPVPPAPNQSVSSVPETTGAP